MQRTQARRPRLPTMVDMIVVCACERCHVLARVTAGREGIAMVQLDRRHIAPAGAHATAANGKSVAPFNLNPLPQAPMSPSRLFFP